MGNQPPPPVSPPLKLYQEARLYLSGASLQGKNPVDLARQLRQDEKYAYAAEVYLKILNSCSSVKERKDILQQLAFCFYKDPDLPSSAKFANAQRYLMEIDDLDSEDFDVLGKIGAIYKYRWYHDNQFESLLRSRYFYQKGYELWRDQYLMVDQTADTPEDRDAGYNAINYAFILELMASVRLNRTADLPGKEIDSVKNWHETAEKLRTEIVNYLPGMAATIALYNANKPQHSHRKVQNWVNATLGEAYFGLGEYEKSEHFYRQYGEGLNGEKPRRWEIHTAARQMLSLADFASDLARHKLRQLDPDDPGRAALESRIQNVAKAANDCFSALYGVSAATLPGNVTRGKVGLALSGGGFRASLFHIGVLAALAERDVLRHVEVLSCVSGGSIIGAYYYLLLKQRLEAKKDGPPSPAAAENPAGKDTLQPDDYVRIVREIEEKFLAGVQTNLRMQVLRNVKTNWKIFFDKGYTRSLKLGSLYESQLFQKIMPDVLPGDDDPLLMHNLKINPEIGYQENRIKTENIPEHEAEELLKSSRTFSPKVDNWKRHHKVPILVLNATSLYSGHNWQFTASWMGEPPGNIRQDIDSKPRLRRMYYDEAPPPYRNNVRLGTAVGASSCVPALFTPIHFPDLYEDVDLHLIDGGVHDNQGVSSLIEQECKILFVSDASGQMPTRQMSKDDALSTLMRSDTILQERVRESQFLDLEQRHASGQLQALSIVHLKKDLQANPIKWKYCEDPTRQQWLTAYQGDNISRTSYGIIKSVQSALAELRTDLDAFNDAEAYALMYSGYRQTLHDCDVQNFHRVFDQNGRDATSGSRIPWAFLGIEKFMTNLEQSQKLLPVLKLGQQQAFRSLKINPLWRNALIVIGILLALAMLATVYLNWDRSIFTLSVSSLAILIGLWFIGHIGGPLVSKVIGYKTILAKMAAVYVLAASAKLYLAKANPQYLQFGKLSTLDEEKKTPGWLDFYYKYIG